MGERVACYRQMPGLWREPDGCNVLAKSVRGKTYEWGPGVAPHDVRDPFRLMTGRADEWNEVARSKGCFVREIAVAARDDRAARERERDARWAAEARDKVQAEYREREGRAVEAARAREAEAVKAAVEAEATRWRRAEPTLPECASPTSVSSCDAADDYLRSPDRTSLVAETVAETLGPDLMLESRTGLEGLRAAEAEHLAAVRAARAAGEARLGALRTAAAAKEEAEARAACNQSCAGLTEGATWCWRRCKDDHGRCELRGVQ